LVKLKDFFTLVGGTTMQNLDNKQLRKEKDQIIVEKKKNKKK